MHRSYWNQWNSLIPVSYTHLEYILEVRETKRGMEELTSDIPNVSEEATKDLEIGRAHV